LSDPVPVAENGKRPNGLGVLLTHYVVNPLLGLLFDVTGGVYRTDGCQFVSPRQMTTIGWRGACYWKDTYEGDERRLIKQFVRPEDSVIELGACIGVVSCVTNQLLNNRLKHLVVEANPLLLPWLIKNRQLNQAKFLVEHCAAGKPPEVTFYIHPKVIVDGTTTQGHGGQECRLPSRSLRELHERYGPFSTLIADIEGSEFDVFEDSADLLKTYRLVIAEFHASIIGEAKVARCKQILAAAGFRPVGKTGFTEAWQRG